MKLDWSRIEAALFRLVVAEIKRVAKKYKGEPFYGFAFDCNSDYAEVLLSLNTESGLQERALRAAAPNDPQKKVWADIDKKLGLEIKRETRSPVYYEQKMRWWTGEWKYMCFQSRAFEKAWAPYKDAIEAASDEDSEESMDIDQIRKDFMAMACRVMVRLENTKILDMLPRTSDFRTWVSDHDELPGESSRRLARIRKSTPT
jgi:hypothetical protein